jgi:hypothetical protein
MHYFEDHAAEIQEIGGEPLRGSGFETDTPESDFDSEVGQDEGDLRR